MAEDRKITEQHGCIVCGKTYDVLVVYSPAGKFVDCTVTSGPAHRITDPDRPIIACDRHSSDEVKTAVARHYPGQAQPEDEEE